MQNFDRKQNDRKYGSIPKRRSNELFAARLVIPQVNKELNCVASRIKETRKDIREKMNMALNVMWHKRLAHINVGIVSGMILCGKYGMNKSDTLRPKLC